ncbi:AAEL012797-PA [Aedes aegypti]|uniref:AAEL012797-PA n=1 Tax=Aedes aegypti TaxID=7159 RepID=Q16L19_AEDAE|nr:AAEL012797-PA [Aedes aegypti]
MLRSGKSANSNDGSLRVLANARRESLGIGSWFSWVVWSCNAIVQQTESLTIPTVDESRKLFGGYRITPKFCNATRSLLKRDSDRRGPTICMFNHECFQRQGEVVGACMDGFLFGTCCELPLSNDASMVTDSLMEQFNYTDDMETTSQSPLSSAIASQYEKFGSQLSGSGTGYGPVINYEPIKLENPVKESSDSTGSASMPSAASSEKPLFNKLDNNYITNDDLDEDIMQSSLNSHMYQLSDNAVSVYSPSTSNIKSEEIDIGTTIPPPPVPSEVSYVKIDNHNNVYSSEIPSSLNKYNEHFSDANGASAPSIESSTDITSSGVQIIANQIYQENQLFDHSDITHPEAETDLFNENGAVDQSYAGPNDFANQEIATEVLTTEKPVKITHPKPQFKPKPKPTQATEPNNYVLVHTISSDTKDSENQTTKPTVSVNNIHSIESIILMLNETNLGPQYETDSDTKHDNVTETSQTPPPETTSQASYATSSIDYEKYGPTSFYITKPQKTSPPTTLLSTKVPSTSYVYSPKPTRRPILEPVVVQATLLTSGYGTTAVTQKDPAISVSTATKRTTKRPTTTTTSTTTTTPAPEDEIIDEEENVVEEEEEEEDVGEETNNETVDDQAPRKILCGQRPLMKSARVVGGKAAKFGEWPWQVLVRESTWLGLFTKNKCGGVLITNEYVVTAAHCQPGFLASLVAVFGEFDISSDLETKRSVTKNVKRVIVHRQYDAATFENDLAILELESPIHYDVHIVPICMPSDEADFTGRMATVTGWGRLTYGGGVPSVLQEVQVPVIENSVCQEMFHMAGHNKKILPSFVCAGYANGKRDSCEGDSGGPLVLQRPDGRYELVGTVSHGIRCAAPYLPGVYMRTTFYKPWLRSVTGVK